MAAVNSLNPHYHRADRSSFTQTAPLITNTSIYSPHILFKQPGKCPSPMTPGPVYHIAAKYIGMYSARGEEYVLRGLSIGILEGLASSKQIGTCLIGASAVASKDGKA